MPKYFQGRIGTTSLEFRDLARPLLIVAGPVILVLLQPDLGTACVITLVAVSMILFTGVGRRTLLWAAGLLVLMLPLVIWVGDRFLLDYQKKRLLTFMSPEYDPLGAGYHIIQSQIAIGSGGVSGKDS